MRVASVRRNLVSGATILIYFFFFFKQKTAYEIGLGIPAEPLFRSKRLLAFSRRLHARIRKTRYMHKMRCLLINASSRLLLLISKHLILCIYLVFRILA